jgi:hypothetical protein
LKILSKLWSGSCSDSLKCPQHQDLLYCMQISKCFSTISWKDYPFLIKWPWHICQKWTKCVSLFLDFVFYSSNLFIYLHTNASFYWLLYFLCYILVGHIGKSSKFVVFSDFFWLFHVLYFHRKGGYDIEMRWMSRSIWREPTLDNIASSDA